jgi:hypothetical protein
MHVFAHRSTASAIQIDGERHDGDDQDEDGMPEKKEQTEQVAEAVAPAVSDASHGRLVDNRRSVPEFG